MSTEEQDAAILRIVKGRAEANRIKALLEPEIRESAITLQVFGDAMRTLNLASYPPEWIERGLSLLSPQLAGKIKEYLASEDRVRELNVCAAKAGIA